MRYASLMIVSVILAKFGLSVNEIGIYESLLLVAGFISFSWIAGLIQTLLPLHNNNSTFKKQGKKSPVIFNATILLFVFSILSAIILYVFKNQISGLIAKNTDFQYFNLFILYMLVASPTHIIEYIYLLNNKAKSIVLYGVLNFSLQVILVAIPLLLGMNFVFVLWAMIAWMAFRFVWLIALLFKYSEFKISTSFIKEHLILAFPLILSTLLSGSAQYIDGVIVTGFFDESTFAIFRYGAREFPLVILMATAFHNGIIPEFSKHSNNEAVLKIIKQNTVKLVHILFPISIAMLLISNWIYPIIYNANFAESAKVFNIYLLLIVSRLMFPQTILIGLKRTNTILYAAFFEIIVNVLSSLILVYYFGIIGVAYATVIAYLFEKIFLAISVQKMGISIKSYVPLKLYAIYTIAMICVYVIVDFVIYA